MTDNEQAQFEVWQKQWDKAAESIANDFADKMKSKPQQPPTSWLTNTPLERDYGPKEVVADPDWTDIYYRSQNIDGVINEGDVRYSKGAEKPTANFGAFTPTKTNPTTQSSTGADGLDASGEGVPVTPNWSDSEDLRDLDDIKRRIERMERHHHEAEYNKDKASPELKKQLESLRDRVQKLSEKINRSPEVDVT